MTDKGTQPVSLQYAAASPVRRARRWVIAGLTVVLCAAGWWFRAEIRAYGSQARVLWKQRAVTNYQAQAGTVAFTSDPDLAQMLLRRKDYAHLWMWDDLQPTLPSAHAAYLPPVVNEQVTPIRVEDRLIGRVASAGVVFLGARSLADGTRRIILVTLNTAQFGRNGLDLTLTATLYEPASWKPGTVLTKVPGGGEVELAAPPVEMLFNSSQSDWSEPVVTILAGQPTAGSEDSFVVEYECNGKKGSITGRLTSATQVTFELSDGPLKRVPITP